MTNLMTASKQWATRPADQRFTSLPELRDAVDNRRRHSRAAVVSSRQITAQAPNPQDDPFGLEIVGPSGNAVEPTHWSFGQLSQLAGAPAGYLRSLPGPMAADCLNYGLHVGRDVEDVGILLTRANGDRAELRAATGPRYGRIWDSEIANALVQRFGDGITGDWTVPGEFGRAVTVDKSNTTLYASDRDMFVFLADETNRVEIPNRRNGQSGSLARGFYVWNSEVGSQAIGAAFFLFDYVCCNRIIWGAENFTEIRLRHTVSAPDRWLGEVAPVLAEYSNSATRGIVDHVEAAQAKKLDDVKEFLVKRAGLTQSKAAQVITAHEREEGRPPETLWDAATGITALAKTIDYQDDRVAMERIGGKVLALAA